MIISINLFAVSLNNIILTQVDTSYYHIICICYLSNINTNIIIRIIRILQF